MLNWFIRNVLGKIVARRVRARLNAFEDATHHPREVQEALLRRIVERQAGTDFGKKHGFRAIQSAADFRRNVPVAGYEYVEPYIRRVMQGETNALLADPKI